MERVLLGLMMSLVVRVIERRLLRRVVGKGVRT